MVASAWSKAHTISEFPASAAIYKAVTPSCEHSSANNCHHSQEIIIKKNTEEPKQICKSAV